MTTETWLKLIAVVLGVPLALALPALIILGFSYRITSRWLVIRWLGIPVRRVRLSNIVSIGTTPVFWAERWPNALSWYGRFLVIRKKHGLFKHLIITPKNPFVFRAELYRARDALLGLPAEPSADPKAAQPRNA